jgi:hypothetical protein
MYDEDLVRMWKDPEERDWPDDDHPSGQMYLHLSAMVGGYGGGGEPDLPPETSCPSWIFSRQSAI